MTEPDEALLRAREIVAVEYENFEDPVSAEWVRRGSCDRGVVIIAAREAYRAGQAASAERIKALERLLGHFLETFCDLTWDPQKEPEVIEARTLLKEGDQ